MTTLVEELQRDGYLKTPRLIEAFFKIDRKNFVPKELWAEAYGNYPLPIGEGQTISQPLTVAFMLELLDPRPGEKILDVGSGSGWTTALLAFIVSNVKRQESAGWVVAIERIKELKEIAERNISKYNFIEKGIVKIILGDGSKGYTAEAPYDKIIAAAAIHPRKSTSDLRTFTMRDAIPQAWKNQLKIGGRIVAPVLTSIIVLDKISEEEFTEKEYFGFSFVPLVRD